MPLTKEQKEAVTDALNDVHVALQSIGSEPSSAIGTIKDELEDGYSTLSESQQESNKGQAMRSLIDDMEEVIDKLDELPDILQEVEAALTELLEKK